jgi:hypothetical protein
LVLSAAVEGADRPALLAILHPPFGRAVAARLKPQMPGLAQVIPMPRVIPMPQFSERVGPDADPDVSPDVGPDRPEPDTAA